MTTRAALLDRIQAVVNRTRVHDRIAEAVLAEIEREYALVEKGRLGCFTVGPWAVAVSRSVDGVEHSWQAEGDDAASALANALALSESSDLDPIGPGAAESDTAEA